MFLNKPNVIKMPVLICITTTSSVSTSYPKLINQFREAIVSKIGEVFVSNYETFISAFDQNEIYTREYKSEILSQLIKISNATKKNAILVEIIVDEKLSEDVVVNKDYASNGRAVSAVITNLAYSDLALGIKNIVPVNASLASVCKDNERLHGICLVFRASFVLNSDGNINDNLAKYVNESASFMHVSLNLDERK